MGALAKVILVFGIIFFSVFSIIISNIDEFIEWLDKRTDKRKYEK